MKFAIKDFELGGKVVEVEAPGIAEAMFEYLPWPTLDIKIYHRPTYNTATVTDIKTDFRYSVKAL